MKKNKLSLVYAILISGLLVFSCEKEKLIEPNQLVIDQLKAVTDSLIQNSKVPGVVALVVDYKQGIDWLYTAGVSDIPNNLPMNSDYTFRIASNTKTLTGTILLQLVDEGKLALNDKLSKYYPEYPKSDSITISMLCNMTSGIFSYTDDEMWEIEVLNNPAKAWTPQELVDVAFSNDFYFEPATGWHYSNTNTIILGMIIEELTGNSLQEEIENRIINPLQLKKTGFLTSGLELPGIHGRGYYYGEYIENLDLTEYFDISQAWAAGSVYSTPRELQKYVETLVSGGFLSDTLQEKRLNDLYMVSSINGYGLCLLKRGTFYGHNGSVYGFTSSMYHSKSKNCTVIIYFNCELDIHPDYLFLRFMHILYGADY
jgi:D-alanyl-D-alanine carboxypeptidase